ncbi:MAG: hypothetical protein K1X94_36310, partial [Sandaracinaceae bacterium]|nr:hypothetical protein [Sandaracinaceae bacterium]
MRRARTALVVLAAMAAFAWLAPAPAFEASFVLFATAACALLGDAGDPRSSLETTRAQRWLLVYAPLVVLGAIVTSPAWAAAHPFVGLDGRVNEAIVGELIDQARLGRPLLWLTRAAPGDPTLDLYPTLAHRAVALVARLVGAEHDTARLLVSIVSAAYVAVAVGIARTAIRVGARWPAALAVGALALLDVGTDFTWGTQPVFRYAFLPSTLSVATLLHTLPTLFDLGRRPSRGRMALATLGVAITAALHPLALVIARALAAVLGLGVALSRPAARRPLVGPLAAVSLGLGASAWLWLPAALRVMQHAVHYGTPQIPADLALLRLSLGALPDGGWMILVALAWLVTIGVITRRGHREARVLGWLSLVLVASYVETPFLELGLAPSSTSVRWQAFRIGAAIKPFSYVLGALAIGAGAELHALTVARPARARALRALAAIALLALAAHGHRSWSAGLADLSRERHEDFVGPPSMSPATLAALRYRIARDQRERPGGRLLMICGLECVWELYAFARVGRGGEPGVELALSQPAPAGWLLRDQFRTTTDENLRRFGIRWAVAPDRALLPGRDEGRDEAFGRVWLRPVTTWDGAYAHVTRGAGTVEARVIPGEGFELQLRDTTEPALVELGTPWYPRLRASRDDGTDVPVYAMPVGAPEIDDPNPTFEHAVALWLAPGTTRVRADGALAAARAGLPLSLLALLLGAALAWPPTRALLTSLARPFLEARALGPLVA